MKGRALLAILSITALAGVFWWLYKNIFANDELRSKREWSVVQYIQSKNSDELDNIKIEKFEDYSLVGIRVRDGRKRVWVMLNSKYQPYYKQLPQGNYELSESDLKRILASDTSSSTVKACLESHETK